MQSLLNAHSENQILNFMTLAKVWGGGHYKTQYRKFETNIPSKGIARPQSQFPHSCVCERFIYLDDWSTEYVERSWEYIIRSQTHECGNWDWGHAIPFLGIHKWDFHSSVKKCTRLQNTVYPVENKPKKCTGRRFMRALSYTITGSCTKGAIHGGCAIGSIVIVIGALTAIP